MKQMIADTAKDVGKGNNYSLVVEVKTGADTKEIMWRLL